MSKLVEQVMAIEFTPKTTKETPPGGWKATIKQTGYTVSHYAYDAFIKAYESHCIANGVSLSPDWEEELKDQMCRDNAKEWQGFCKRVGKFPASKGINFGAVMSFLNVVKDWAKNTMQGNPVFVTQEEAERRASICAMCPMNSKTIAWGCGRCMSSFVKLLKMLMGDRKTSYDPQCGICKICQCAITAAVHVPLEPQQNALPETVKEKFRDPALSFCWKAKGL